jgi:cytochrome c oxidase assembly protein subunit 15
MDLTSRGRNIRLNTLSTTQRRLSAIVVAAIFLQIILGAFVAGMKAGHAFNTWPLMDGHIIPAGIGELSPWWLNITENPATVQFDHRIAAYLVAVLVVVHALAVARQADDERLVHSAFAMVAIVIAQIGLGVWTVLASVPLWLGLAHQGGALILFAAALWHRHRVIRSAE